MSICFTGPQVVDIIEAAGWRFDRQSGSHRQFKRPPSPNVVTVAYHSDTKPIPQGTLHSIMDAAELGADFTNLLAGKIAAKGSPYKNFLKHVKHLAFA